MPGPRPNPPKSCEWCGEQFVKHCASATAAARFCSKRCSNTATAAKGGVEKRFKVEERIVPLAERFWRFVVKSSDPAKCWGWAGATNEAGYGQIQRGARGEGRVSAHRLSWELHNGSIPEGIDVLHRCDNPPCSRPACLFLGTNLDNIHDRMAKGRPGVQPHHMPRGAAHQNSRLTEGDVRAARRLRSQGRTIRAIAETFGVSSSTMYSALRGKTWSHVE